VLLNGETRYLENDNETGRFLDKNAYQNIIGKSIINKIQ